MEVLRSFNNLHQRTTIIPRCPSANIQCLKKSITSPIPSQVLHSGLPVNPPSDLEHDERGMDIKWKPRTIGILLEKVPTKYLRLKMHFPGTRLDQICSEIFCSLEFYNRAILLGSAVSGLENSWMTENPACNSAKGYLEMPWSRY